MDKYEKEYMEILNTNVEVKIDSERGFQKALDNFNIKPTLGDKIISALKRKGIDVSFIDPVTFKEYKYKCGGKHK